MLYSVLESIHDNNEQKKDNSISSFVVPVNSGSAVENISRNSIENTQSPDEAGENIRTNKHILYFLSSLTLVVVDIINENHIIQKEIEEKQASVKLSSNTKQFDECSSDISFEHRDDNSNDGFISPTAWKTRSRVKGENNIIQHIILLISFSIY